MTEQDHIWSESESSGGRCWRRPLGKASGRLAIVLHDLPESSAPPDAVPPAEARLIGDELSRFGFEVLAPWDGLGWWTDGGVFAHQAHDAQAASDPLKLWIERIKTSKPELCEHPPAIVGYGSGGHAALRFGYRFPREVSAVAGLRPEIDWHKAVEGSRSEDPRYSRLHRLYGEPERARQDSATLHIHPLNWPRHQYFACPPTDRRWESADRLRMKLYSLGVPHECELEAQDDASYDKLAAGRIAEWLDSKLGG